jgi:hypothetical protein
VTAVGQQLVVLGGFDNSDVTALDVTHRVDALSVDTCPGTSCTWRQLPDSPVARHHAQLAGLGTMLYLLGGLDVADAQANYPARGDSYVLDLASPNATWKPLKPIPVGYERGSAAVVVAPPSRIYLLGGAGTTMALASNI